MTTDVTTASALFLAGDGPDGPSWSPYAAIGGFVVLGIIVAILYGRRNRHRPSPRDGSHTGRWVVAARATLGLCGLANLVQAVWHPGSAAWDVTRIVVSTLFLVALFSLLVRFFAERRRLRHGDAG